MINRGFIILGELEKIFYMFLIVLIVKSLAKVEWVLKKVSKSYSNNQWLLYWELKWFNKEDILYAITFKLDHS